MKFQELQQILSIHLIWLKPIIPFIALLLSACAAPSALVTPVQNSSTEDLDTQQVFMSIPTTQVAVKTTTPSPEIYPVPVEKTIESATGYPEPSIPSLTPTQAWQKVDGFAPLSKIPDGISVNVTDMRIAPDGGAWLVGETGVSSYKDDNWSVYFDEESYLLAGSDDSGKIWIVSKDGTKVLSWDGDDWKASPGWMPINAPFQVRIGEDLITDTAGNVWLTTFQDIRVFDGNNWKVYTLEDIGFKLNPETTEYDGYALPDLAEDGLGRIWIGNCDSQGEVMVGQGVRWFDGVTWESGDALIGTGCVWDIASDEKGRICLGVNEVLWCAPPGSEFFQYTPPDPPEDVRFYGWIEDIAFSPDGTIWPSLVACGGASCGVAQVRYNVKDSIWQQIGNLGEYLENEVFFDADGTGWLFSQGILSRIQGDSLMPIKNLEVQAATVDKDSRLWIVSNLDGKPWLWRQVLSGE